MNRYLSALGIGVLIAVLIAASMSIVNAFSSQQTLISCMDITTPGYYYLALNITGLQAGRERCIGIFTGNVVLDGNGYSLLGNGGFGVLINAVNVTVKNIVVAGYDIGVCLESGSGSDRLVNITVRNNRIGVQIGESNNNILIGIVASSNEYGVQVNSAKNNIIISSLIVNNEEDGVQFGMSTYNVYSLYNIIVNTTISNNKNAGIMVLESTTYYLSVVNTTLSNNNYGLYFKLSNRNTVVNSILVNNNWGVVLDHASENVFYNNYFSNNYSNVLIYGGVNTWSPS
jgi:parallel beta-helix repeat protein